MELASARKLKEHAGFLRISLLAFLFFVSVYSAFATRFDGRIPPDWLRYLPIVAILWTVCQCLIWIAFGLHRSLWSLTSVQELLRLIGIGTLASAISSLLVVGFLSRTVPPSILLLNAEYSLAGVVSLRVAFRWMAVKHRTSRFGSSHKRALIYGADAAGAVLLSNLRSNCPEYRVIGFLDDRPELQRCLVDDLRVLGGRHDLGELASRNDVDAIFASTPARLSRLRSELNQHPLPHTVQIQPFSTLPRELGNTTKEMPTELLLDRPPVKLDLAKICDTITDQVVMVTGAAGSIGSELCRQIAAFQPKAIIGFEISETALFYIDREMKTRFRNIRFIPCIGNIQNPRRLAEVLRRYQPALVYHAAAYKHVPLMERHLFEVVENNVIGTEVLLSLCEAHGVGSFVMISSDKAVRPSSIMGATKRVAELIVKASLSPTLNSTSVRFGNVLGSNGSVIPIFRAQIEKGGPVTVTHPMMERYFMTIPEAAQLVLQASSFGSRDTIFVLDMGKPVKVVELAERLIRLMGYEPYTEINIEFTGMRPGEKLSEQLTTDLSPTIHEKIAILKESALPPIDLFPELKRLRAACSRRSAREVFTILAHLVPEYIPSDEILGTLSDQAAASGAETRVSALVMPSAV